MLDVPAKGTRPTSDRVRESLFGALESAGALNGARVLDLYAGSGALGLEALSRSAASVDLVERAAPAAAVIRRNLVRVNKAMGGDAGARVHHTTVAAFLGHASGPYDLVLLDPPYELAADELHGALALLAPLCASEAMIVIERASQSPEPVLPAGLAALRSKRYGDTTVWWAAPVID